MQSIIYAVGKCYTTVKQRGKFIRKWLQEGLQIHDITCISVFKE